MIGWYEDTIDREANLPIRSCLFQCVRNLGRMETAHSQAGLFSDIIRACTSARRSKRRLTPSFWTRDAQKNWSLQNRERQHSSEAYRLKNEELTRTTDGSE
jgi:hypothetical protein